MILTKDLFKRSSKETNTDTRRSGTCKVTVRFDVGFPNTVTIRGKGGGLSWDKGITLKNISRDTWVFEPKGDTSSIEFKVLINDQLYETGYNHSLKNGDSIEYTPTFY